MYNIISPRGYNKHEVILFGIQKDKLNIAFYDNPKCL